MGISEPTSDPAAFTLASTSNLNYPPSTISLISLSRIPAGESPSSEVEGSAVGAAFDGAVATGAATGAARGAATGAGTGVSVGTGVGVGGVVGLGTGVDVSAGVGTTVDVGTAVGTGVEVGSSVAGAATEAVRESVLPSEHATRRSMPRIISADRTCVENITSKL